MTPATRATGGRTPGAHRAWHRIEPRVRGTGAAKVENARVAIVQRGESTFGPVAVDGRTITLVARAHAFHLRRGRIGALGMRTRPTHVEILDEDGRRDVVQIHDVETGVIITIMLATAGYVLAVRALRRRRSA